MLSLDCRSDVTTVVLCCCKTTRLLEVNVDNFCIRTFCEELENLLPILCEKNSRICTWIPASSKFFDEVSVKQNVKHWTYRPMLLHSVYFCFTLLVTALIFTLLRDISIPLSLKTKPTPWVSCFPHWIPGLVKRCSHLQWMLMFLGLQGSSRKPWHCRTRLFQSCKELFFLQIRLLQDSPFLKFMIKLTNMDETSNMFETTGASHTSVLSLKGFG